KYSRCQDELNGANDVKNKGREFSKCATHIALACGAFKTITRPKAWAIGLCWLGLGLICHDPTRVPLRPDPSPSMTRPEVTGTREWVGLRQLKPVTSLFSLSYHYHLSYLNIFI